MIYSKYNDSVAINAENREDIRKLYNYLLGIKMLELIPNLVDRVIQLLRERDLRKKRTFDLLAAPLYSEFEKLHEEYLQAFYGYRDIVMNESAPFDRQHHIFDRVHTDHCFNSLIREKLRAIIDELSINPEDLTNGKPGTKTRFLHDGDSLVIIPEMEPIETLAYLIKVYISGTESNVFHERLHYQSNYPRSSLISGLNYLVSVSDEKIMLAELVTDDNCFSYAVGGSPPTYLRIMGEQDKYDFIIRVNAQGHWVSIQQGFVWSNRDPDKLRRVLAVALIDKIVVRNSQLFVEIVKCFQNIQRSLI